MPRRSAGRRRRLDHVAGALQASTQKVVVDARIAKFGQDGSLLWDRGWGGKSGDVGGGVSALRTARWRSSETPAVSVRAATTPSTSA